MKNTYKATGFVLIILGVIAVSNILVDLAFWRIVMGIIILGIGFFLAFKEPESSPEKTASKESPEEYSRVICEACNTSLPEGSAFCSKCGEKF